MKSLTTFIAFRNRTYMVEYFYYKQDNEIELIAIDNNSDLEDVYNDSFLEEMGTGVREHLFEGGLDYSGATETENGR